MSKKIGFISFIKEIAYINWCIRNVIPIKSWKFNFQGYDVYLDDTTVNILSGGVLLPMAIINFDGTISVNNLFMTSSPTMREAILFHEIGHVHCGHLQKIKKCTVNKQFEMEADEYAASKSKVYRDELIVLLENMIAYNNHKYIWPVAYVVNKLFKLRLKNLKKL